MPGDLHRGGEPDGDLDRRGCPCRCRGGSHHGSPAAETAAPAEADLDATFFRDLGRSNLSQEAKNAAAAAYRRDKELRESGWKPEDLRELRELGLPKEEAIELRQMFPTKEDAQRSVVMANDLNRLLTEFETQPAQFVSNLLKTAQQNNNVQAFDAVYEVFQKDILSPQNPAAVAFFERCARNFFTNHLNGRDADRAEAAKIFLEKDFAQPAQPDPVIARREAELAERERRFNEAGAPVPERGQRVQGVHRGARGSHHHGTRNQPDRREDEGLVPVVVEEVTKAVLTGTVNQILGDAPFIESMERYRRANGNTAQTQEFILSQVRTKAERIAAAHTNNAVKRWNGYGVVPQATAAPRPPPPRADRDERDRRQARGEAPRLQQQAISKDSIMAIFQRKLSEMTR